MNEINFEIAYTDNSLINKKFSKLIIISPMVYKLRLDKGRHYYVKVQCECGNILFIRRDRLSTNSTCNHCYDNKYYIINNFVSLMLVYDYYTGLWCYILINTNCVDYIKSICNWGVRHHSKDFSRLEIYGRCKSASNNINRLLLSRTIVSYINSKYNLPPLLDNQQIDHISGNTFNNLYYPFNDYYNNLRVCTDRQNNLNKPCKGYTYEPEFNRKNPYRSRILIDNKIYTKSFSSPLDCIKYNNALIHLLSPEDVKYYYHSPLNPRNWNWTFNAYLESIGYNDNEYKYCDNDFID